MCDIVVLDDIGFDRILHDPKCHKDTTTFGHVLGTHLCAEYAMGMLIFVANYVLWVVVFF